MNPVTVEKFLPRRYTVTVEHERGTARFYIENSMCGYWILWNRQDTEVMRLPLKRDILHALSVSSADHLVAMTLQEHI